MFKNYSFIILSLFILLSTKLLSQDYMELLRDLNIIRGVNENSHIYLPTTVDSSIKEIRIKNKITGNSVFWNFDRNSKSIIYKEGKRNKSFVKLYLDSCFINRIIQKEYINNKLYTDFVIEFDSNRRSIGREYLFSRNNIFSKWQVIDSTNISDGLVTKCYSYCNFNIKNDSLKSVIKYSWQNCSCKEKYLGGVLYETISKCPKARNFSTLHEVYSDYSDTLTFNHKFYYDDVGFLKKVVNTFGDEYIVVKKEYGFLINYKEKNGTLNSLFEIRLFKR